MVLNNGGQLKSPPCCMLTVIEISFIHCFSGVVLSDSWQKHEHLHILPTTWNRNQECDKVFPCWNLSAASLSSKNLPAEMPLQTLRICEDFEHNYNTPVQTKKNMNLVLEIDYPIYRALHFAWCSPFMRWPREEYDYSTIAINAVFWVIWFGWQKECFESQTKCFE